MTRNTNVITATTYLAMLFLGVGSTLIGATAQDLDLTPSRIGVLLAAQNVGFMASVLVSGALADTHDKPRILALGSVLLAAAFLAFYRTELFWVNLAVMVLSGIGMGAYEGVADALQIDLHARRAGLHINVNHFFVTLGAIVISLYPLFMDPSQRLSVIWAGGIGVLLVAVVFGATRLRRSAPTGSSYLERFRVLLTERMVIAFFAMAILAVGVELGTIGYLTSFLELRNLDASASQMGLVIFLAGMAAGRLVIGWLSRTERIPRVLLALFILGAVLFAGLLLLELSQILTYGLALLAGMAISALLPLMLALAGLRYRGSSGTVLGAIKVAIPIGGILIPILMSALTEITSLGLALWVFPAALSLGALLLLASGVLSDVSYSAEGITA